MISLEIRILNLHDGGWIRLLSFGRLFFLYIVPCLAFGGRGGVSNGEIIVFSRRMELTCMIRTLLDSLRVIDRSIEDPVSYMTWDGLLATTI